MTFLQSILKEEPLECILQTSGSSNVMNMMTDLRKYYDNDFMGKVFLLQTALGNNGKKIIFLSAAPVYDNPTSFPANENTSPRPN
jgi:UDP-glucose 4-epimerase